VVEGGPGGSAETSGFQVGPDGTVVGIQGGPDGGAVGESRRRVCVDGCAMLCSWFL